jgi:hypothetical protein
MFLSIQTDQLSSALCLLHLPHSFGIVETCFCLPADVYINWKLIRLTCVPV